MVLTIKPLNFNTINAYSYTARLDLVQGNGGTYYVQLMNQDGLRYVPAVGATVSITFPRASTISAVPSNQDVTATCTVADARDASIYRFDLTALNVDKIAGEGARITITESGTTKSYMVDHLVTRKSNLAGA